MMIQLSPIFLFLLPFLFPLALLVKHKMIKSGKTNLVQKKMPPGPWKLPLIGNLHQMILSGSSIPHHILAKLAKKHGPVMHLQIGEMSAIVISSPEAAQEAFTTHDLTIAQRPQNLFLGNMTYNNSGVALSPHGTHWKTLRKMCIAKLLNPKRVQSYKSIREEEVYNFINSISSSLRHDGSINLTSKLSGLNNCIISRATFGKRVSEDYQGEFVSLLNKLMELVGEYLVYQIFPSLKFVHRLTGLRAASENIHIRMDKILQNILDEHNAKRKATGVSGLNTDSESREDNLVDMLLRMQASVDLQFPITTDTIKAVILDMLLAGVGNPSITIEWAMAELLKNPRAMEKAQAEVRQAIKNKKTVEEADVQELKYLKSVIKETLRLHPPLPAMIRESRDRFEIQEYEVLGNTKVVINAWAIGRDPKYWVDPNCFLPERFLDSSISFRDSNYEYIPFGGGRRMCPGMLLGISFVELPLAQLLYHFDWKLPDGINSEELDMNEICMVVAKRRNDLLVIPTCYVP